jgi:CRP-like cAMP-binding protein
MAVSNEISVSPRANRLLGALSDEEYAQIAGDLRRAYLGPKAPMVQPNEPIEIVDFPLYGVASQLAVMRDGTSVEVGPVGREGTTGLPLFLGAAETPILTVMQIPGESMRMSGRAFRAAVERLPSLRRVLQLYAESTVSSMAWWVACNRIHVIEQRMARWLLMSHDRVLGDEFDLTQEFLAQMMGVRRASVSEVAGGFQADGLIRYSRGRMEILAREGLEARTCECYWVVAREWDRLLGADFLSSSKRGGRPIPAAEPFRRPVAPGEAGTA